MNPYLVSQGQKIDLAEWDPNDTRLWSEGKANAKAELKKQVKKLQSMQQMLHAQQKQRILSVLQGMDTSGKDGTIRHVFGRLNPQGVRVKNFKTPTPLELAHDYLWRVHPHVPGNGEISIFNRSHYEDVLVVRVHDLVPKSIWKKRYEQINQFERLLADEGTTCLKFFLFIDKNEQKERLQARLDEPLKNWKFNPNDLKERKLWDNYIAAYNAVLSQTSTKWAPWYIIPSNKKWYRNLTIARIVLEKLNQLDIRFPDPEHDLQGIEID